MVVDVPNCMAQRRSTKRQCLCLTHGTITHCRCAVSGSKLPDVRNATGPKSLCASEESGAGSIDGAVGSKQIICHVLLADHDDESLVVCKHCLQTTNISPTGSLKTSPQVVGVLHCLGVADCGLIARSFMNAGQHDRANSCRFVTE